MESAMKKYVFTVLTTVILVAIFALLISLTRSYLKTSCCKPWR